MEIEIFVVDRYRAQTKTKQMRTVVAHCRETDSLASLDESLAEIGTEVGIAAGAGQVPGEYRFQSATRRCQMSKRCWVLVFGLTVLLMGGFLALWASFTPTAAAPLPPVPALDLAPEAADVEWERVHGGTLDGATVDTPAAPLQTSPTVAGVNPTSAPNDLDFPIVITGTGFTAMLSGTLLITAPAAYLGDTALVNVTWVSSATLEATVPWGMDPGVYSLTVVNPDSEANSLPNAFTITQGIGVWQTGGPYGGWVESLVLGDNQGEIVYALLKNVGLFRSRNGGESWDLRFIEIGHENHLEVDPTNPDRLYISKHASGNNRLYRSEDGGDTWTALPLPLPQTSHGFFAFVSPHDGTLFGTLFVLDLSDPPQEWGGGLFRFDETDQTWTRLEESGVLDETTGVSAVGFDPTDPQIIYAGLIGGKVVKSTDGGETWSAHSQSPLDYIKELVVNPVGGELWICGPGGLLAGGLYRYDGAKWVAIQASPYQFNSVRNLVLDPSAAVTATQHIWVASSDGLLKSGDGGQNWVTLNLSLSESIALNPMHSQTIYGGNADGAAKSIDGGASWQPVNQGMTGIIPSFLGINPQNPGTVYACFTTGFGSLTGGQAWQQLVDGGCAPIVVDPSDPQHVLIGRSIADDGWHFDREFTIPLPPELNPAFYIPAIHSIAARPGMWLMGVGFHDNRLPYANLAGGGGIYLSEDGENWTWVDPLLSCPPTSMGFDPVDPNVLYAATSGMRGGINCDGTFLKSTDSGQTWQESLTGISFYGDRGNLAIETMPPYRLFLGGSYVSTDQATTWNEVNSPSESYINQLLYLPGVPSVLYAATGVGLFRSIDGAQTWQRASGALGQLEIWSLAGTTIENRQTLYVASVGGVVNGSGSQALGLASGNEQMVDSGVYRFTTLSLSQRIYLPLVLRH